MSNKNKKVANNANNAENPQPKANEEQTEKKPGGIKRILWTIGKIIIGVFAALGVIGTIGAVSKNFGGGDDAAEVEAPEDE